MDIITDISAVVAIILTEADKLIIPQKTQGESLTDLMEKARQEGGVYLRRDDGLLFLLRLVVPRSPFDIAGVDTDLTQEEIVEAINEGRNSDRW